MHEIAIAHNIVKIASEAAQAAGAKQVKTVHLLLGAVAGVTKSSLLFGWEIAIQDTILAGASLEIEETPLVIYCPACDREVILPDTQNLCCPLCDTSSGQVVQGRELMVKSLEIVDECTSD